MKYLTGYSLKQWLAGLWVLFDQWRKHTTKAQRREMILNIVFFTLVGIVGAVEFYVLYLVLWAVNG